ncbi:N-6 DNA methylase [Burkholderia ubonensis]|uniref:site-specific DNA-methyltransferase (adenine-specific) n=2 Tax=Burkholderia ubonensis TaxID=101571 RepID=A0AA40R2R5_9BURK|nr:N-6 DNA methylase [Burkholderia ubonensis]KVU27924.1 N-6 DNA methylase [Burkholderia ubonensis]KVU67973.1 N-6 DNA methylase [Burkholderia ubonensis]KWO88793.1 N-6 DNA methylase [Burkholderia ubonensis]KWZ52145.1 N-6 DNA methylase [Burkholderia ubonensis]
MTTSATKSQFLRLVRALRAVTQAAQLGPDVVVGSALARWCKESFPGLPRSGLQVNAQLQHDRDVGAFVDFVKGQELLEATYWLSSAYAQLASDEHRKQLAMFFTPPSLTKRLLDDLMASGVDFAVRKFCDPACGGAAFLAPIAMRMRDALRARGASAAQIVDHVERHILGFDKEVALCEMSKHFLLMVLHEEVVATGTRPKFQVSQGDSLLCTKHLVGTLDVVVCNPPFRKMPSTEVAYYQNGFADIIEAQPNLYALFVALCVRLLALGGTCALVTPTSFLSGQYFSKLRTFLKAQTTVLSIGMVSDRLGVFIDVEQETALTLARREQAGLVSTTEADVSVVARDGHYVNVGRCVLPDGGTAWPIPRTESDVALLKSAAKSRATLADYGYTPRIGAFVWNRDTRTTYPSAKSAARARGGTAVPLLWSSDISPDGCLRFSGAPKANKEHCFVNLGAKDHCSVVRRPSVLLQRVTSNSQPRRLVAAAVPELLIENYGGFVGENHTVILEQVSPEPALTPEQLAQLFATPTVDRYFRCISGATNVSIFELSQLRLPDPGQLRSLLAQGYDMPSAARKVLQEQ